MAVYLKGQKVGFLRNETTYIQLPENSTLPDNSNSVAMTRD